MVAGLGEAMRNEVIGDKAKKKKKKKTMGKENRREISLAWRGRAVDFQYLSVLQYCTRMG